MQEHKTLFVTTQVCAERLVYKTLQLTGKKLKMPNLEDMTRRYLTLYDDLGSTIEKIEEEDHDQESI